MDSNTSLLTPSEVFELVCQKLDIIESLNKEIKLIKSRCKHNYSFSHDGCESGFECSGCGSWRRRLPPG